MVLYLFWSPQAGLPGGILPILGHRDRGEGVDRYGSFLILVFSGWWSLLFTPEWLKGTGRI
jgi:hypothetical protein